MLNKTRPMMRCAALLAALLCGAACADPVADKLSEIEAKTLLLKARERQLDVQASILGKENDIASKQSASKLLARSPAAGDPVVQGVEGLGHALFATLQLSDGSVIDVQAGDVLANGMRVVSIAPGNVIVFKGRKRVRLARQAPRPAGFDPAIGPSGLIPPLPAAAPRGAAR